MVDPEKKALLEKKFAANFATDLYPVLADIYFDEAKYDRARSVCEIGLSYHPGDTNGLFMLAQIAMAEGELEESEVLLKTLVATDIKHSQAVHLLVTIMERLERPKDDLIAGWQHLLKLDPHHSQARVFLKRLGVEPPPPPPEPEPPADKVEPQPETPPEEPAAPAPPDSPSLMEKQDEPAPADKGAAPAINTRMATFTLVAVLKDQGLFHQALEVLDVLEKKGSDPDRITAEREAVNNLIQASAE